MNKDVSMVYLDSRFGYTTLKDQVLIMAALGFCDYYGTVPSDRILEKEFKIDCTPYQDYSQFRVDVVYQETHSFSNNKPMILHYPPSAGDMLQFVNGQLVTVQFQNVTGLDLLNKYKEFERCLTHYLSMHACVPSDFPVWTSDFPVWTKQYLEKAITSVQQLCMDKDDYSLNFTIAQNPEASEVLVASHKYPFNAAVTLNAKLPTIDCVAVSKELINAQTDLHGKNVWLFSNLTNNLWVDKNGADYRNTLVLKKLGLAIRTQGHKIERISIHQD